MGLFHPFLDDPGIEIYGVEAAGHGVKSGMQIVEPMARRLDAINLHAAVIEEWMEQPHGVRAAADAGKQRVGQAAFGFLHLLSRLVADHALEVAHNRRVGMRARDRADAVERVRHVGDPVAQRLVHRVLQGARARHHRPHLGAERLHAHHVRLLAVDVDRAHVHDAFEPPPMQARSESGRRPSASCSCARVSLPITH